MESSVQVVHTRELDIHVQAVGAGPPLVVVGGPQLGHQYMRPLDALAKDFRLVYYDARGSGGTDIGDASQLTFSGAVDDLEALRQALELDRISVLGHSLGGHVAYLYAALHPEHLESLILVDVGPPVDEEFMRRFWRVMQSRRSPEDEEEGSRIRASAEFKSGEPAAVERFMKNLYGPFFRDSRTPAESDCGFTPITAANVLEYEERPRCIPARSSSWPEMFGAWLCTPRLASVSWPSLERFWSPPPPPTCCRPPASASRNVARTN